MNTRVTCFYWPSGPESIGEQLMSCGKRGANNRKSSARSGGSQRILRNLGVLRLDGKHGGQIHKMNTGVQGNRGDVWVGRLMIRGECGIVGWWWLAGRGGGWCTVPGGGGQPPPVKANHFPPPYKKPIHTRFSSTPGCTSWLPAPLRGMLPRNLHGTRSATSSLVGGSLPWIPTIEGCHKKNTFGNRSAEI